MDQNGSKYIKIISLEILAVWCHFESRFLYNRATIRQGSSSFPFSLSFSFSSQSLGSPQRTGAEVRRWCHSWSLFIRFFLISPFEEPQTKIQEWDCYQHIRHRKAVSKLLDSEDPESESESEPFSWGENWVPTASAWLRRLCCSSCLDMNLVILYEHNTGILCVRHHGNTMP